eukprot:s426_g3.t1
MIHIHQHTEYRRRDHWHWAWPGAGKTRISGHHFFSNFADHQSEHSDVTREIVGKGSNKETKLTDGGKDSALGVDKSSEVKDRTGDRIRGAGQVDGVRKSLRGKSVLFLGEYPLDS